VARHCAGAPPELVEDFRAKAERLRSMHARLGGALGPSTAPDVRDTAPSGAAGAGLEEGAEPVAGYRLARRIARGGFGEVWEARGPGGFPAALKFVALGGGAGAVEAAALERVKGLRHSHLLALFGAWRTVRWLVIASELADRSLADRLRECRAEGLPGVPGPKLLRHLRDCAECLDYLNGVGVQHRDVKPHNLLPRRGRWSAARRAGCGRAHPPG
jgi:serine/threonine protein kinase